MKSLKYNLKTKTWDLWVGRKVIESGDIADLFRKHPDARHHGPAWKPT